jgi:two-component system sensor histidine kinase/response regulator
MKLNSSIIAYLITINILFVINYKYNSGINGPTPVLFILSFFLTISIVPKKQYWFWIILNIAIVIILFVVEYKYPAIIRSTYTDNKSRFIDFGYSHVVIVLFIFMVTTAVRKSYSAEKELVEQKAAELEMANDTKNKLFSILAHDLRSPLASIQNYLEIISELKLDEDERLSINKKLLNSTQNTQQMLANLLYWSKAQMEGVVVNMVRINLKEVLESTIHIHQAIAAEKHIRVVDNITDSVLVMADADMLQLIVRNLVNNAIKFTEPGGVITISANMIDNYCRLILKDNGTGIPLDQQNDIFSLKSKTTYGTKNEKGVGLGLVLCKEFAELQNGKISFASTAGKGTTFYLDLKLPQEANDIYQPKHPGKKN